jgi:hypothetical protein
MATCTLVNALMNGEVDRNNDVVQWTMRTVLDLTGEAVTLGVSQHNGAEKRLVEELPQQGTS